MKKRVFSIKREEEALAKSFKVITGKVRFSYVNVFAPIAQEDGKPAKYSVALIIPKSDQETIDAINLAVYDCKRENADLWDDTENLKGGLRDGDLEKNDPAYDGCMFINATSTAKPGVVDKNCKDIIKPSLFYSGCYGRASVTFYGYNNGPDMAGIGCTINNVQKLSDGDKLGGFCTPAEDFGKSS